MENIIYKVKLREKESSIGGNSYFTEYLVSATSPNEAGKKSLKAAKKDWKGIALRVSAIEETNIQVI
jgi:hypothetical protein